MKKFFFLFALWLSLILFYIFVLRQSNEAVSRQDAGNPDKRKGGIPTQPISTSLKQNRNSTSSQNSYNTSLEQSKSSTTSQNSHNREKDLLSSLFEECDKKSTEAKEYIKKLAKAKLDRGEYLTKDQYDDRKWPIITITDCPRYFELRKRESDVEQEYKSWLQQSMGGKNATTSAGGTENRIDDLDRKLREILGSEIVISFPTRYVAERIVDHEQTYGAITGSTELLNLAKGIDRYENQLREIREQMQLVISEARANKAKTLPKSHHREHVYKFADGKIVFFDANEFAVIDAYENELKGIRKKIDETLKKERDASVRDK